MTLTHDCLGVRSISKRLRCLVSIQFSRDPGVKLQGILIVERAMAESYNGQQGDPWDAQKDLALAWLDAIITIPLISRWECVDRSSAEKITKS